MYFYISIQYMYFYLYIYIYISLTLWIASVWISCLASVIWTHLYMYVYVCMYVCNTTRLIMQIASELVNYNIMSISKEHCVFKRNKGFFVSNDLIPTLLIKTHYHFRITNDQLCKYRFFTVLEIELNYSFIF